MIVVRSQDVVSQTEAIRGAAQEIRENMIVFHALLRDEVQQHVKGLNEETHTMLDHIFRGLCEIEERMGDKSNIRTGAEGKKMHEEEQADTETEAWKKLSAITMAVMQASRKTN